MSNQKLPKMYNLNVNVATTLPVNFLGLDGQSNTPRTPEIVNSLVAMTNPFDALMKPTKGSNSPGSEESYSETVSPLGRPISHTEKSGNWRVYGLNRTGPDKSI